MEGTSWDSINKGQMLAFSSFVPPRVLFALDFYGNGDKINYWIEVYDTCNLSLENLNNIDGREKFEPENWYFVAVVVGSQDRSGRRSLFVMSGSQPGTMINMKSNWCSHMPEPQEFLQGFTVPGGLLMSPIEMTGRPMTVKELQTGFYKQKPLYRRRRGPQSLDEDRINFQVHYQTPRAGYPHQVSLVTPPLLLQTRTERSDKCAYELGVEYNAKVWGTAVNVTCRNPYLCTDGIMTNPTELMACSSNEAPDVFFGQEPIPVRGQFAFYDFLQSIADAEIVMRGEEAIPTRAFLDTQTKTLSVLMVTYSAQFGICSTIEIKGTFSSDVKVDFTVSHFQSLEGEDLAAFIQLTVLVLVLSCIIFVEKILTARYSVWGSYCGEKDRSVQEWSEIRHGFFVDLLIQVVLPVLYFSIRLEQILKSREEIQRTIGVNGLAGVPWESRDVELRTKIDRFFFAVNRLEDLNRREYSMNVFYFVLSIAQLLRLIMQTRAHPRTAILVNTFVQGLGDLWHFMLLLLVALVGFIMLGTAQFAEQRNEFASGFKLFETLWEMLLGSMPQSGMIPSAFWTYDKLFMLYLLIYNFLSFMFMLNFIIGSSVQILFKPLAHCSLKCSSVFKSMHLLFWCIRCNISFAPFSTHSHHLRELPGCGREDPYVRNRPRVHVRHFFTPAGHLQVLCLALAESPRSHFQATGLRGAVCELHRNACSIPRFDTPFYPDSIPTMLSNVESVCRNWEQITDFHPCFHAPFLYRTEHCC